MKFVWLKFNKGVAYLFPIALSYSYRGMLDHDSYENPKLKLYMMKFPRRLRNESLKYSVAIMSLSIVRCT